MGKAATGKWLVVLVLAARGSGQGGRRAGVKVVPVSSPGGGGDWDDSDGD